MLDSLYISVTGLHSHQSRLDTISNNLANVNTPGFKKARVSFEDLMFRPLDVTGVDAGDTAGAVRQLGSGTYVARNDLVFNQGDLRQTQRPLDFAIQGQGFFPVEMPDGSTAFTRLGAFRLNELGEIVNGAGLRLAPGLRVPSDASEIVVSPTGVVSVRVPDEANPVEIGRIELASFVNVQGLRALGEGLYVTTADSGEPFYGEPLDLGLGRIQQGFVEASNVDFVEELSELVLAQRAYQLNARALQAADEILAEINSLRR